MSRLCASRVTSLRAQLQALPTRELERIDALDVRALALTEQRDQAREQLERTPPPPRRRLGRGEDPHLVTRTRLASTLRLTEQELERVLSERAAAVRELGQPDAIRQERDDLTARISEAERQHLSCAISSPTARSPRDHAGPRRRSANARRERSPAAQWDRTARAIARYRLDYNVTDQTDALGPEPDDERQRSEYRQAQRALEHARDLPEHDLGLG